MTIQPVLGAQLETPPGPRPGEPGSLIRAAAELVAGLDPQATLRAANLTLAPNPPEDGQVTTRLRVTQADPLRDGVLLQVEAGQFVGVREIESGVLSYWVPEIDPRDIDDRRRVASPEWGTAVAAQLASMPEFATATAYYDGTIGLAAPGRQVQFRIYKGAVIEVARRTVKGADFTLSASGGTWLDLITTPTNEFMDRAMEGEFSTDGDGYEYLRTTKVLVQILDAARTIAQEAG